MSTMVHKNLTFGLITLLLGLMAGCSPTRTAPPLNAPLMMATMPRSAGENDVNPPELLAKTEEEPLVVIITPESMPTPTLVVPDSAESEPVANSADAPLGRTVSIRHGVPAAWKMAIESLPDVSQVETGGAVELAAGEGDELGKATYALVVPLYSFTEAATWEEVEARWQSEAPQLVGSTDTLTTISQRLGQSAAGVIVVDNPDALVERVWAADDVWGIVPLAQLSAELRTLTIDGQSPLDRNADINRYPLAFSIGAIGDAEQIAQLQTELPAVSLDWQPDKLTRVAMTGVTALVRATAYFMEQNGILWAGEEVREVLNSADIAHLSNEVAFVEGCPYPNWIGGTSFCSDIRYFELVKDLGIDVMELTGNHVNDFGWTHLDSSITMYEEAGMKYFGGGRNSADAQTAAIFEHNGNRIAFLGCNPVGPSYAWAGPASAGSRPCDADLKSQIRQLADEGAIVIVTLQYHEFYFYQPTYQQQVDFRSYVDAGATIVSGSQGHHAQGFDLYGDGFIHYGLGNLFFDQMDALGTRQAMIDEYIIYDGQLAGVEFTTGLIENYARPRLMSAEERRQLFQTLFNVSTR